MSSRPLRPSEAFGRPGAGAADRDQQAASPEGGGQDAAAPADRGAPDPPERPSPLRVVPAGDAPTEPLPSARALPRPGSPPAAPAAQARTTVDLLGPEAGFPLAAAPPRVGPAPDVGEPTYDPEEERRVGRTKRVVGRAALGVGATLLLFVAYLFVGGDFEHARRQAALLTAFEAQAQIGPPQPLQDPETSRLLLPATPAVGAPVALLEVPDLDLAQVVVQGTRSGDLMSGPGHLPASALPGEVGTVVIAGRRTTFGAPFNRLDGLEEGDEVVLTTTFGRSTYRVTGSAGVAAGAVDRLSAGVRSGLTLTTSDPPYQGANRLAVYAELVDDEPRPPGVVRQIGFATDELGLAGHTAALLPLLVFAQLLALAGVATYLLYRRWSWRATYLVTTPVLVVLLILVFESLARLLPATL